MNEAKQVRDALKAELGLNSRAVSVRRSGCSIRVTIKRADVKRAPVEEIAERAKSIRYCEASGEILQGGNTFVFVDYSDEAREVLTAPHREPVKAAAERLAKVDVGVIEPTGNGYGISEVSPGSAAYSHVRVWNLTADVGGCLGDANLETAAEMIGRSILENSK